MAYLEDKNIVHRDLALRNLLVAPGSGTEEKYFIKVSDFGLSRVLKDALYKKIEATVAIRWCSTEIFEQGIFSIKVKKFRTPLYNYFTE